MSPVPFILSWPSGPPPLLSSTRAGPPLGSSDTLGGRLRSAFGQSGPSPRPSSWPSPPAAALPGPAASTACIAATGRKAPKRGCKPARWGGDGGGGVWGEAEKPKTGCWGQGGHLCSEGADTGAVGGGGGMKRGFLFSGWGVPSLTHGMGHPPHTHTHTYTSRAAPPVAGSLELPALGNYEQDTRLGPELLSFLPL